jgi:glutamate---cysteine ligase / carboxylate-amine ligase
LTTNAPLLREAFDRARPLTVGIEDEVMLLDPQSLQLASCAADVLARLNGDPRFKLELPASQLEIVAGPREAVGPLVDELLAARRALSDAASGLALPAVCGVHPFSPGSGELNRLEQYRHTIEEYAEIARLQLVCALQVHVAIGSADLALSVYNAARSYLPLLAALAANAPFYEGRDTGLASVRPKLCELLPRQGVPPPLESWAEYAEALRWGARAGAFASPRTWWWELRPHPAYGTLEFRVPDGQSTVARAGAIAAVAQALVAWLSERARAGELPDPAPSWRIEENRWSAARHGAGGAMADLETGALRPTSEALHALLDSLVGVARQLGSEAYLDEARAMIASSGAAMQRQVARDRGVSGVAAWCSERFLTPARG